MAESNENDLDVFRQADNHGDSSLRGQKRRALSNINVNIIGSPLSPCSPIAKRSLSNHSAVPPPLVNKRISLSEKLSLPELPSSPVQQPQARTDVDHNDDSNSTRDVPDPTLVPHFEALVEEIDSTENEEKVGLEDIDDDESVDDIDEADENNPLAVVEYVEPIYANYKDVEVFGGISPSYMEDQPDINERMRAILIDWLIEVHYKFDLREETLYLTVNLIDRFLAAHLAVSQKILQLVGITSMLLACKYEEISVPVLEDFILITDRAYTRTQVLDMEKLMVNTLQFNLSIPTPYIFMRRFLKAAQSDRTLELLSFYMIELCLVEYQMLKFSPSLLAAASIFTAQATIRRHKLWSRTSEWHTTYSEDMLIECSRMMVTFHQKAGSGRLTSVYRKYSTPEFEYTARSEPALFLLVANKQHDGSWANLMKLR